MQYSSYQYITNTKRPSKQSLPFSDSMISTDGDHQHTPSSPMPAAASSSSTASTASADGVQPTESNTDCVSFIIDAQQDLDAMVTPYFITVLDDALAVFNSAYTTETADLTQAQQTWLDNAVDEVLDDLQLASVKERFTVKPFQFSRTQLALNMHLINIQLAQVCGWVGVSGGAWWHSLIDTCGAAGGLCTGR
jgi:hypothetical protein